MESIKKKGKQTPAPPPPSPTAADSSGGGVDRISALDDDLCELILRLARLDVRELVRTSVLSKRWRGLWKRSPVLDFFRWPELESAGDIQRYIAIVNDVLEQRAGATSEARIYELKIPLLFRVFGRNQWTPAMEAAARKAAKVWIEYAMHHQVKVFQFNLGMLPMQGEEVPVMDLDEFIPSSPTLECLHLDLGCRQGRLPSTAVFTSLKGLTLECVELAAGSVHLLTHLLSSACCPILQKLRMRSLLLDDGTNKLVLEAGELLELSIEGVYGMELLELRTPKLLYFNINSCKHLLSLRISAPVLKELTYFSNTDTGFIQGRLPCVQHLKIHLFSYMVEGEEDPNHSNICLLKLCSSSVRCLLVHLYVPPEEMPHIDLIKDNIPQLPNVTSLLLSIGVDCLLHSFGDGVAGLLTKFKNLEYLSLLLEHPLHFGIEDEYYLQYDECYSENAATFSCNHAHHWELSDIYLSKLREAEFRGMTGTGCELRFLQFVLASATDLQSVTVSFNLCFIEGKVQDSRMGHFLHSLRGNGTWTTREDEDLDNEPYKCSKFYKWTPSS